MVIMMAIILFVCCCIWGEVRKSNKGRDRSESEDNDS